MTGYILIFLIALTISLWITPLIRKASLRLKIIDKPTVRKIHTKIVTRGGGIAIFLSFFTTAFIFMFLNFGNVKDSIFHFIGLFFSSTVILLLGIYDDFKGANAKKKFLIQILAAAVLISFGIKITVLTNPFGDKLSLSWLSIPFTLLWLLFITNALNLIDGLDGLAAGVSSIISLTLFLVAMHRKDIFTAGLTAALAGSTFGFLRYNFNPAKIFMGDSGSLFLGFILAAISIKGLQKGPTMVALLIPIVCLGYPVIDTLLAIVRRALRGANIFKADEEHIHHQILKMGLDHKKTVLIIYVISLALGLIAFVFTMINDQYVGGILLIMSLVIFIAISKLGFIEFRGLKKYKTKT